MNQPLDLNLLLPAYQSKRGITALMVINILLTITLTMGVFTAYQQLTLYRRHREVLEARRDQLQLEIVRQNSIRQNIADLEERLKRTQEQTAQLRREFSALMENRPRRSASLAVLIARSEAVRLRTLELAQDQLMLVGEAPDTQTVLDYARLLQDGVNFQRASLLSLEQGETLVSFTMLVER